LNTRPIETPTPKRKNGITKSASVTPNHGEWFNDGKARPTSSTNIINCTKIWEFSMQIKWDG
jgi:hypothetical protein